MIPAPEWFAALAGLGLWSALSALIPTLSLDPKAGSGWMGDDQ